MLPLRGASVALFLVAAAGIAGVGAWASGSVDLGLQLTSDRSEVRVADVTPDGIAARDGVFPGALVLDVETRDGGLVPRGRPRTFDGGGTISPPIEALPQSEIAVLTLGYGDPGGQTVDGASHLVRDDWERRLSTTIWIVAIGLGLGAAVWWALRRRIAGPLARHEAVAFGAVVAAPHLVIPAIFAGSSVGIAAGYLVPTAGALLIGCILARRHLDRAWRQTGISAAVVLASLAVLLVVRRLTSQSLPNGDQFQLYAMIAAISLAPAAIAALAHSTARERTGILSLGLLPIAATTAITRDLTSASLVAALLGWQLLPVERITAVISAGIRRITIPAAAAAPAVADPIGRDRRDIAAYIVAGLTAAVGLTQIDTWAVIIGLWLGAAVGFAIRRGFLGSAWTDAAVPLGVAAAVPIMLLPLQAFQTEFAIGPAAIAVMAFIPALAALPVAHLLAARIGDPTWRRRSFIASCGLVTMIAVLGATRTVQGLALAGFVAVIPGAIAALADRPDGPRGMPERLETLAVALTPGVAMTVLTYSVPNPFVLIAWLVALVVWRRFTLAPLLGLAARTQQQRDLAVVAVETERARLAADLHDDALQELSALVRRLDAAGDPEGAELARGVAERLRAICSDLRLPLLDDLGAGPALEWLVARIRPLADGDVHLERTDPTRPPSGVELAVFRVAQEALANAVKHGKAPITVRYHVDPAGRVSLSVDDAGPGIDAQAADSALSAGHMGVANMQQRAEQIGGLLDIRRWPTGGTHVALDWRPQ